MLFGGHPVANRPFSEKKRVICHGYVRYNSLPECQKRALPIPGKPKEPPASLSFRIVHLQNWHVQHRPATNRLQNATVAGWWTRFLLVTALKFKGNRNRYQKWKIYPVKYGYSGYSSIYVLNFLGVPDVPASICKTSGPMMLDVGLFWCQVCHRWCHSEGKRSCFQ